MTKRNLLVSSEDDRTVLASKQHHTPCSDCPWRRDSLAGWLGTMTSAEWIAAAHGEARIECHTLLGAQCAGAAIYRANVAKSCRDPDILQLVRNRQLVFGMPAEFKAHHGSAEICSDFD